MKKRQLIDQLQESQNLPVTKCRQSQRSDWDIPKNIFTFDALQNVVHILKVTTAHCCVVTKAIHFFNISRIIVTHDSSDMGYL